ncbi:thioredoxin family protein [Chitinophaga sancti]|uniref:Thioredoxin family protein n=1 Tax=Chitinophaga sancti TaxID=1004 RepID=A0A1K1SBP8_9BACT|nr:thioredoxin family protein [Chitinophaga sancti]WQD63571.1 thioredoxin family protein [Chitinophaga sancti]WQG90803.1 thioredoxin family protein [Chitinophaga sancti]SFW81793.1 Thioredoxin-like [Chitinophaga sancti]
MIKSIVLYIVFIFSLHQIHAQGIQFATTDLATALDLARQQNKLVFVDVYTDWCAPCKKMEKTIFPQAKVGQLYNENFISCRVNGEKDKGPDIVKKYRVGAYPTFLFINPEGELVAKGSGYEESADPFLELGRSAIRKKAMNFSFSRMKHNYEKNKNNKQFLAAYIEALDSLELKEDVVPLLDQYCKMITTPSGADYNFLLKHVFRANSAAFDILLNNQADAYQYFNKDSLFPDNKSTRQFLFESKLNNTIIETIMDAISTRDEQKFRQAIFKDRKIDHQNPKYPLTVFSFSAQFYTTMKDTMSLLQLLHRFSDTLLPAILPRASSLDSLYTMQVQEPGWKGTYIFYLANTMDNAADKYLLNSRKKSDFQRALTLSNQVLRLAPGKPMFINTSARAYYLLNEKERAIQLQKQAVKLSEDIPSLHNKFMSQLADMQAGKRII